MLVLSPARERGTGEGALPPLSEQSARLCSQAWVPHSLCLDPLYGPFVPWGTSAPWDWTGGLPGSGGGQQPMGPGGESRGPHASGGEVCSWGSLLSPSQCSSAPPTLPAGDPGCPALDTGARGGKDNNAPPMQSFSFPGGK